MHTVLGWRRGHAAADLQPGGSGRTLVRLAGVAWAISVLLLVLGELLDWSVPADALPVPAGARQISVLFDLAFAVYGAVGTIIVTRRPHNAVGWVLWGAGVTLAAGRFAIGYGHYALFAAPSLPAGAGMAWLANLTDGTTLAWPVLLVLLFPTGRPLSRRWRSAVWLTAGVALAGVLARAFLPGPIVFLDLNTIDNPFGIAGAKPVLEPVAGLSSFALILLLSVSLISMVLRFRRARGEERLQLKWFTYALALGVVGPLALLPLTIIRGDIAGGVLGNVVEPLVYLTAIAGLPIATGIAILRYRLYDIDQIINRTLVYGALTACVVAVYVLVVGYLGALFRVGEDTAVSLLAAGVVAVLFQPLRDRLQRGVNRLMYGERDDPYAVLSRLGRRLEETLAGEAVLQGVVETVAGALRLPYVALALREGDSLRPAAVHGTPVEAALRLPLVYQAESVGELALAPRAPGEQFTPADRRLLEDLARHAGAAAHAVRLTADLQRSRERLVTAQEEERRRLRRDLHDGLGPALASLTLKLDAARNLLARDPAAVDVLLAELKAQTQAAIADIRRLVYALRPPALDELGLVSALREQAAQYVNSAGGGLHVSIEAPEPLPPLPAAVEVAAYRIALEALTNAVRHAQARSCQVRLAVNGALELEIADDGVGLPADARAGVGLSSMRERAAELGGTCVIEATSPGGSRVGARLPLSADARDGGSGLEAGT